MTVQKEKSNSNRLELQELRKSLELQLRQTGDGESEPHTPPTEMQEKIVSSEEVIKKNNIGTIASPIILLNAEEVGFGEISFRVDLFAVVIFVFSAATRFYNLAYPHSIVFDELHYGKYASLYLRRVFFFDPHPPLGKQLIAASAALFGPAYNGTFRFDRIGSVYPDWFPVFGMRFVPALTGSFVPSVTYLLSREIGVSHGFSLLVGLLLILDNAMLIQSRYILMEMPMILFGLIGLLFAVKYTKQQNVFRGWLMAAFSAFFGTLSLSVKYIGSFYLFMSALIILWHLWTRVVPRKDLTSSQVLKVMSSVYTAFWATCLIIYISIFYIHLGILIQAGPHDSVMTSAFQASLKGGLASIIKGQPVEVSHGSQVTLRHALGRPCWLHSHPHNYPVKYTDGRGSSHQQQVTCYSFKDVNNWWIIKRPSVSNLAVNETKDVIKNGDEIHLVHGITGRLLNSHDVAAPQSPQNQEVSCYIDHNVSMIADPIWRLEITSGCGTGNCEWQAVKSMVRFIHVSSGQALRMSGKQLPKWGFDQHEVVTDRIVVQDDTSWNVEEHRYTKSEKDREKELLEAEMIPTKPTILSFWAKFFELQWKMLVTSGGTQSEAHTYSSFPSEWLFLQRGIAYWIGVGSNAQIHLLGNPVLWLTASFTLFVHGAIIVFYLLLQRRGISLIGLENWPVLIFQCGICLGGYALTYIYHFCVDRTLFLHHYLPSYLFKTMLLNCTLDHIDGVLNRHQIGKLTFRSILILWIIGALYTFNLFSPLSYGEPSLTRTELESLKWRSTWDFIVQKHT